MRNIVVPTITFFEVEPNQACDERVMKAYGRIFKLAKHHILENKKIYRREVKKNEKTN